MKSIFSIACLLLVQTVLTSQTKPEFFPEDISRDGLQVRCYCKPGVRNKSRSKGLEIAYTRLGSGTFEAEDNSVASPYSQYSNWERLKIGLKVPLVNKENLKILLSYKYFSESFSLSQYGIDFSETFQELNARRLKKNSIGAIITKPLNESKYLAFRFGYAADGNYSGLLNFKKDYAVYKALGLYGVKKNEDLEWGVGLSFSKSFRRTTILPFLLYNRNFNKHWGIESVFPAFVYGRYNFSPISILLFGFEYNSDSYRMKVDLPNNGLLDYGLNHSEVTGMVRLEQQITPWVWANVRVGYQMNFSTDFESKSLETIPFNVEPTGGLVFQIGLFISPPDRFMGK
jgi:hypothetical protein